MANKHKFLLKLSKGKKTKIVEVEFDTKTPIKELKNSIATVQALGFKVKEVYRFTKVDYEEDSQQD